MIFTSHPQPEPNERILSYLKRDIGLTQAAINLAIKKSIEENAPFSVVLWSYGLINAEDYERLLDWIDKNKV